MAEKVIIIGSGPAGLAAAIYTARERLEPLVISGADAGGQLMLTTAVENYPGFPDGIQGPELIEQTKKQAERFGTRFVYDAVAKVDLKAKPIRVYVSDNKMYEADSLIIATGAKARTLGLASESRFMGRGVSTCATCDGAFYRDKDVVVVGGGDTAMEDSTFLTRFAKSVTIVHRRDQFRASKAMQERALNNPKIKVVWNTTLEDITGDKKVTGVKLKDVNTGKTSEMKVDGVFFAIGYVPNTQLFAGQLPLDDQGYIATKEEIHTGYENVFVAGDVADRVFRQAATASGSGVKCALAAREYLAKLYFERGMPR